MLLTIESVVKGSGVVDFVLLEVTWSQSCQVYRVEENKSITLRFRDRLSRNET